MDTYYALINKMTVKSGRRDEVVTILLESGKPFNDNPSCILYLVYKDKRDPNIIWVEDVWTNQNDHTAAMSTPEMRSHIMRCVPLLEGMPEQIEITSVGGKGLASH